MNRTSHEKNFDGFVKSSKFFVALHPSSLQSTLRENHHSGFARLEFGAFFFAIGIRLFTSLSILSV